MRPSNVTYAVTCVPVEASAAGEGRSARLVSVAICAAVFLLPFLAYAINILHAFYVQGSSLYDAGHYAYMLHDGGFQMENPRAVGGSYLGIHISPLFFLTTALGHLLPLSRSQFYAVFVGISHTLPGIAVYWLLVAGYRMTAPRQRLLAALLALLFSFSGLALAIAKYPNLPMFLIGCAAIFLAALVLRKLAVALLFFALCLITREDAGFHLFALLSLCFVLRWRQGADRAELRPIAGFAAAALVYSAAIVVVQLSVLHEHSLLVGEYIGWPPFAHVTPGSIATRLLGWAVYRNYVIFPALLAIAWAITRRDPQVVLGYVAYAPWAALHLVAARPLLATLPSYYAFPFVLAGFWPLSGLLLQRRSGDAHWRFEAVCGFVLLTAVSFFPSPLPHDPTGINLPADFFSPPSFKRQLATDRAVIQLAGAAPLGTQVVDESIAALVPESYAPASVLPATPEGTPDTVIYAVDGFQSQMAEALAARAGLLRRYAIPGTMIRLASRYRLGKVAGLTELPASEGFGAASRGAAAPAAQ